MSHKYFNSSEMCLSLCRQQENAFSAINIHPGTIKHITFYLLGIWLADYWRIFFHNTSSIKYGHLKCTELHIHKSKECLETEFMHWKYLISSNTLGRKRRKQHCIASLLFQLFRRLLCVANCTSVLIREEFEAGT